jgi:hypothetical protein
MSMISAFLVTDLDELESTDVFYDRSGYVQLRDGSRLDVDATAVLYNRDGSLNLE